MSVKLRLTRMGSIKKPFYRIVAMDSRKARDGQAIEVVGTYNPIANPAIINVDSEKALKWINNGAQPSDTVRSILISQGILPGKKENK